jgi:tRNA-specific 2-thiouridylase
VRIVAAMSGGVDSSVAAALLVEEGHEVIGVHMKLHDTDATSAGHCCGLDDARDARRVADRLGIPFYVLDLREAFRRAVMDDLAAAYAAGRTPNPCVQCNAVLKFDVLLSRARALGADALATGHYARTDGATLRVAADPDKDQSYFLWPIRPEALACTRFPLGGMTKPEVRAHAARLGLVTAQKPDSMEVCFLPDDDHTRFVAERFPELDAAGEIVDTDGRVLGHHDAYHRFTVGQRRGLRVASTQPLYVLRIDAAARRVVVGPAERLVAQSAEVSAMRWLRPYRAGDVLHARTRHRGALVPCGPVEVLDPGDDAARPVRVRIPFRAPARAAAPGQSLVLYDGDVIVAGGTVHSCGTAPGAEGDIPLRNASPAPAAAP